MPPKIRFHNEDIIQAAFQVLQNKGWDSVSARSIAKALQSSTTPIYTYLKSMKNLEGELIKRSFDVLQNYQRRMETGDALLNKGVGYVLFAMQEKYLFRFLYGEKSMELNIKYGTALFDADLETMSAYPVMKDLSHEQRRKILFSGYVFCHGLANLLNNSIQNHIPDLKNEKAIIAFIYESLIHQWEGVRLHQERRSNKTVIHAENSAELILSDESAYDSGFAYEKE